MIALRLYLLAVVLATVGVGFELGSGEYLLSIPLVLAAGVALWPLWVLTARHVKVLVGTAQRAQGDPGAHPAREASPGNGGVRASHRGPER
jgi:hypothetical protein